MICIWCGREADGTLWVRGEYVCSEVCGERRDGGGLISHGDSSPQLERPSTWKKP